MKTYKLVLPPEVVAMAEKWPELFISASYNSSKIGLGWIEAHNNEVVENSYANHLPKDWLVEVPEEPKPLVMRVGGRYRDEEGREWKCVYNSEIGEKYSFLLAHKNYSTWLPQNGIGSFIQLVEEIE